VVAGGAATGNDLKTIGVKTLANGGPDATHTACDVSYFLIHFCFLFVNVNIKI
jgi:hypothetical protein